MVFAIYVATAPFMMTSSNGIFFRVTGPLCGEFTGHRWNPPHEGQWRRALMFSFICAWLNGWVNNREAGDLRRHRAHYDVIVMWIQDKRTHARPTVSGRIDCYWLQTLSWRSIMTSRWAATRYSSNTVIREMTTPPSNNANIPAIWSREKRRLALLSAIFNRVFCYVVILRNSIVLPIERNVVEFPTHHITPKSKG